MYVFSSLAASFPPWPATASHTKWPAALAANTRYLLEPVCVLHVHMLCMLFWNLSFVFFFVSLHFSHQDNFLHFLLKKEKKDISTWWLSAVEACEWLWACSACSHAGKVLLMPPWERSSSCDITSSPVSPVNVCSVQLFVRFSGFHLKIWLLVSPFCVCLW